MWVTGVQTCALPIFLLAPSVDSNKSSLLQSRSGWFGAAAWFFFCVDLWVTPYLFVPHDCNTCSSVLPLGTGWSDRLMVLSWNQVMISVFPSATDRSMLFFYIFYSAFLVFPARDSYKTPPVAWANWQPGAINNTVNTLNCTIAHKKHLKLIRNPYYTRCHQWKFNLWGKRRDLIIITGSS